MKRLLLLAAFGLATATALPALGTAPPSGNMAKEDTIQIKLANGAVMTLALKNTSQLKSFRNYSLDSLMQMLEGYIAEAEKMEHKGGTTEEYTITFKPSSETSNQRKPEKINITFKNPETGTATVIDRKGLLIDVEYSDKGGKKSLKIGTGPRANCDSVIVKTRKTPLSTGGINFDLGFNTLLNTKNNMLDVAGLKPWGSRYISINPYYQFRLGGEHSPMRLRTGLDFAFNNYMFGRNYVLKETEASGTSYTILDQDPRKLDKTKLATSTVNLPLMAILDVKGRKVHTKEDTDKYGCKTVEKWQNSVFRIGMGGFVGYRLGSHTKVKFSQEGRTEKDKDPGNFNLEDLQYGVKFTIGFRSLDLFANYNLNELFKDGRGPRANTLSFGITL